MTKPLRKALEIIAKCLPVKPIILEIGSLQTKNQENIANLRPLFKKSYFVGLDMRHGNGVDLLSNAQQIAFKSKSFDLILCLETLEHAQKPWQVANQINRILKNSGIIIASSQQNFPIHLHPFDYFRYTPYGLKQLFSNQIYQLCFAISPPFNNEAKLNPQCLVIIATNDKKNLLIFKKIKRLLKKNNKFISGHKPYRHRLFDALKYFKRGLAEINFRQVVEFF